MAVSGIIAARLLGVEDRGYLALLTTIAMGLNTVGLMGIPQAITYYASVDRGRSGTLWASVKKMFLKQLAVLFVLHLVCVLLYVHGKPWPVVLAGLCTLLSLPGLMALQYALAFLKGTENYSVFNLCRLLPSFCYAVLVIFALFVGEKLIMITLFWSLVYLVIGILSLRIAVTRLSGAVAESAEYAGEINRYALKGWMGSVVPLQSFRLDQLAAGLFLSPAAAGLYAVALAFTNLPSFISQSIGFIAAPAIASDPKVATVRFRKFFWATFAACGLIALALFLLLSRLIPFLFGEAFVESVPVAKILMIGAFFASLRVILGELYRGLGWPELSSYGETALTLSLFLSAPWMMMLYGLSGLAGSVALSYVLSTAVIWFFGERLKRSQQ